MGRIQHILFGLISLAWRHQDPPLIGHFRHESGHYYWDALIASSPHLENFRALFGDERADYAEALRRYYANGPSADWPARCISAYASAHPWEDWAETWAHYLHMADSLETAAGWGLSLRPRHPSANTISAQPRHAVAAGAAFDTLLEHWLPLTHAFNSINRGLGLPDLYPYVLSNAVSEKLRFVHDLRPRPDNLGKTGAPASAPPGQEVSPVWGLSENVGQASSPALRDSRGIRALSFRRQDAA